MERVRHLREYWAGLDPRRRMLVWALAIGLFAGWSEIGAPLDSALWSFRNKQFNRPASGQIVVVAVDDKSIAEIGQWPWPRSTHAQLLDRLTQSGAKHVYFDITFRSKSSTEDDSRFAAALDRARGEVSLITYKTLDPVSRQPTEITPSAIFASRAELVDAFLPTNALNQADRVATFRWVGAQPRPALSFALANKPPIVATSYPISYVTDVRSIPIISAADIVEGRFDPRAIRGKNVVVGLTSSLLTDPFSVPGYGTVPGVIVHTMGAETLLAGTPVELGWFAAVLIALGALSFFVSNGARLPRNAAFSVTLVLLIALPAALQFRSYFLSTMPGILALVITGIRFNWWRFRRSSDERSRSNAVSGLPNLTALRHEGDANDSGLVVARIRNFSEVTLTIASDDEELLVRQIASRLEIGGASRVFQGDEGVFAWLVPSQDLGGIGGQLEALHALFRSALTVGSRSIDLMIAFGVVAADGRAVPNRLSSALLAADEASAEGSKWKAFDPAHLVDAEWRLSLLGQLDSAIGRGDIWVAYQPKLDLRTNRITGAEALVRWSHPEKGVIAPDEFIRAAEQHGRIDRLTDFVLESAIRSAAGVNAIGVNFGVAVNLSTTLLEDQRIVGTVQLLLTRYKLRPDLLTLEVTESAALATGGESMRTLEALRAIGVKISIDDYGTGHSTLEYLRAIPSDEIKIDRGFIANVAHDANDRLLVESTIGLAHSLGRTVVAEGIEDEATQLTLTTLGCDVAQGYLIGRPMKLVQLMQLCTPDIGKQAR
jgi:EAL domain-containing protein (putative c-di-GMP-specific phosphodiesterase class I)/CHASE2 domain-containing sensor protein